MVTKLKKVQFMNPGMLGQQMQSESMAYSEPWNIQKFDGI